MNYSFGWWDFVAGKQPMMVNRFSAEQIVQCGGLAKADIQTALAAHPDTAPDDWQRFEYRHADFCFPLAVFWQLDAGRIIVDYNISAAIWRHETNATTEYPPYGGWVRVDEALLTVFRLWPSKRIEDDGPGQLSLLGGWLNGGWSKTVTKKMITFPTDVFCKAFGKQSIIPSPIDELPSLKTTSHKWSLVKKISKTLNVTDDSLLQWLQVYHNKSVQHRLIQSQYNMAFNVGLIGRTALRFMQRDDGKQAAFEMGKAFLSGYETQFLFGEILEHIIEIECQFHPRSRELEKITQQHFSVTKKDNHRLSWPTKATIDGWHIKLARSKEYPVYRRKVRSFSYDHLETQQMSYQNKEEDWHTLIGLESASISDKGYKDEIGYLDNKGEKPPFLLHTVRCDRQALSGRDEPSFLPTYAVSPTLGRTVWRDLFSAFSICNKTTISNFIIEAHPVGAWFAAPQTSPKKLIISDFHWLGSWWLDNFNLPDDFQKTGICITF